MRRNVGRISEAELLQMKRVVADTTQPDLAALVPKQVGKLQNPRTHLLCIRLTEPGTECLVELEGF